MVVVVKFGVIKRKNIIIDFLIVQTFSHTYVLSTTQIERAQICDDRYIHTHMYNSIFVCNKVSGHADSTLFAPPSPWLRFPLLAGPETPVSNI